MEIQLILLVNIYSNEFINNNNNKIQRLKLSLQRYPLSTFYKIINRKVAIIHTTSSDRKYVKRNLFEKKKKITQQRVTSRNFRSIFNI